MNNDLNTATKFYNAKREVAFGGLHSLVKQIAFLHYLGASLKVIHEYAASMGYQGKYAAFTSWLRRNVDFDAVCNAYQEEFKAHDPRKTKRLNNEKPEISSISQGKTSPCEINQDKLLNEGDNVPSDETPPKSNAEKIAKMKASMEKLLGGETFDDQFAALAKERKSG